MSDNVVTEEIVNKIQKWAYRRSTGYLDPEDLSQDILEKIVTTLKNNNNEVYDLEKYIYVIAKSVMKDKLRKYFAMKNYINRMAKLFSFLSYDEDMKETDNIEDPTDYFGDIEIIDIIERNFNEIDKKIIKMKLIGFQYNQIAEVLGVTKSYISHRKKKIECKLNELLRR